MNCESRLSDPMIVRLIQRGVTMQRDLDYMRQLLSDMEQSDDWVHPLGLDDDPVGGVDKQTYHVCLLADEDLLCQMQPGVYRMTAKAHDFLDNTRDAGIWQKSKVALAGFGNHSITMLMSVAEGYVRQKLIDNGVPLA